MNEPIPGRVVVPALDALVGQRLSVLDDGFVRVIDYMGGDNAVVQAARVSYGEGTKPYHEDRGLIRYLMRHNHTTPFEMCELKLHIRAPMDCWRQWIRHRTANVNEYSTRYSVAIDAAQKTRAGDWRLQTGTNRQGSEGTISERQGELLTRQENELLSLSRKVYEERLSAGIAREQARKDLPLSTYTEAYWKIDLHNLFHFLALRMSRHAQLEIRSYAETIGFKIVAKWCPIAWESFVDYRLGSLQFSAKELDVVRALFEGPQQGVSAAVAAGLLNDLGRAPARGRELTEFDAKLQMLGIVPPWRSEQ